MKIDIFDNGKLISSSDTRTVSGTAAMRISAIKEACARAIEETGLPWMVQRAVSGGDAIPEDTRTMCADFRQRSNDLEARIASIAAGAAADDDKAACDAIESVAW